MNASGASAHVDCPTNAPAELATMPLSQALAGQEVVFVSCEGGRRFQHRLAEMGLLPGARFRVLRRAKRGPFLIALKDTRLMLGHGMVPRVLVRPVV